MSEKKIGNTFAFSFYIAFCVNLLYLIFRKGIQLSLLHKRSSFIAISQSKHQILKIRMVKCAMALFLILCSDLLSAKKLLIETESSEEENGSGWIENSWQNDWVDPVATLFKGKGNDYNDCKNLRECLLNMKTQTMRPRIDPLGKGK